MTARAPGSLLLKVSQQSAQEQHTRRKYSAPKLSAKQVKALELEALEAMTELDDSEGKHNRIMRLDAQTLTGVLYNEHE